MRVACATDIQDRRFLEPPDRRERATMNTTVVHGLGAFVPRIPLPISSGPSVVAILASDPPQASTSTRPVIAGSVVESVSRLNRLPFGIAALCSRGVVP